MPTGVRRLLLIIVATTVAGCASAGAYPSYNGQDLDCSDVGHPVQVNGADPHGLDADGDGIGCES
jgi:hypothetical protein